jgi:hypothetical protein
LTNHLHVPPSEYSSSKLEIPKPEDIPNIDLEVMNYHRPAVGTFHSKYMVVDRKFAVISSNNVQENDNLEMMNHLEGPIVNGLYDVCMISWHEAMKPPLPTLAGSNIDHRGSPDTFQDANFLKLFGDGGLFLPSGSVEPAPAHNPGSPNYDDSIAGEVHRMQSQFVPHNGKRHVDLVAEHINETHPDKHSASAPEPASPDEYFTPFIPHPPHEPVAMAFVNRKPSGKPTNSSLHVPQNAAWLSAVRHARHRVFIQSPDVNASPLLPELLAAVRRGVEVEYWVCLGYNDSGELLPLQGGTNEMVSYKLHEELKSEPEETRRKLKIGWYVAKDQDRVIHKKEKGRSCHGMFQRDIGYSKQRANASQSNY